MRRELACREESFKRQERERSSDERSHLSVRENSRVEKRAFKRQERERSSEKRS